MNPTRAIRRLVCILAGLAGAFATAAPAALAATSPGQARALSWADPPRPPGWDKHPPLPARPRPALSFPPGWNKHPPLPAHLHPLAAGAIPGWQLTLMAVTVVLLAAVLVAIAHPGRTAAGKRTQYRTDDHLQRHADPPGQPAGPAPARRNHRAVPRP